MALRADRQGAAEHGHRITAAIACHVARTDGTVDQLTELPLHPEHEGGRHARNIALRSRQARALNFIRQVWASASKAVSTTRALDSRHDAHEVLAALRDRIETTPWRGERGRTALRVPRAHHFAMVVKNVVNDFPVGSITWPSRVRWMATTLPGVVTGRP